MTGYVQIFWEDQNNKLRKSCIIPELVIKKNFFFETGFYKGLLYRLRLGHSKVFELSYHLQW